MAHRIVQRLAQEGQAQAQQQAQRQADQAVAHGPRAVGVQRRAGLVHHRNVVGRQAAGHAHLLEPLQQRVVHLPVGFQLALEQVQVHAAVLHRLHLLARLVQPLAQLVFLAFGRLVLRARGSDHGRHFALDACLHVLDLCAQLHHLRKVRLVDGQVGRVFGLQPRLLLLVGLHRLAVDHLRCALGAALHLVVQRLGLDALLLHARQRRGQLREVLAGHIGALVQHQNGVALGVLVDQPLGILQLRLGHADLVLQEAACVERGLHPPLQVHGDEGLGHGVGNAGRQLGVAVDHHHVDQARIAHRLNAHRTHEGSHRAVAAERVGIGHGRRVQLSPGGEQSVEETRVCVDGLLAGGVLRTPELGLRLAGGPPLVQPHGIDHALGQGPALEQFDLRLQHRAVVPVIAVGVHVLAEGHHPLRGALDLQHGAGLVHRRATQALDHRRQAQQQRQRQHHPFVFPDDAQQVLDVQRVVFGLGGRVRPRQGLQAQRLPQGQALRGPRVRR